MSIKQESSIQSLLNVMARLRDPDGGCPWDLAQSFETIVPYTIEEAYEVADAIDRGDMKDLKDELGDLLLQVVYHARMAEEEGHFDFGDVVQGITEKMIHRHPHIFGDETAETAMDVENRIWEERKDQEEKRQAAESVLDDVPKAFPALKRAQKLQKRAAKVGFVWPDIQGILEKIEEEIGELRAELNADHPDTETRLKRLADEFGDILFVMVKFGMSQGLDVEDSLRQTANKFERRFRGIEDDLKAMNSSIEEASLAEMEEIWQAQKLKEKSA